MTRPEPLAVVGIGCRFPRGDGKDAYFGMLERGEDAVTEVPRDRFDAAAIYDRDPEAPGKSISRWGGFLDDVASFDWRAFAISPREAKQMDPQQRLMLEVAWEALEDAGLPLEKVEGTRTGVYVGAMWLEYQRLATQRLEQIDPYTLTGNHLLFCAGRVSHFFDLRGPSIAVDVGCTASLVALHYACRDLWAGETDLALAGGVNVLLSPESLVVRSKAGALSPDGRCKTFDASANGMVPAEGCGVVVLKRLQRALEDGDRIYALIRGTALNHNGRTPWIQATSAAAQESLIRDALERAGVHPDQVDYVELHGTGTATGDPVEARALAAVFGRKAPRRPLLVGSAKSNLGHPEAAGSIAHVIKVALSLHRGVIPPSIHLRTVNPDIDLDALGLEVVRAATPWPRKDGPKVAGVTSASLGGGNAHAVLQEAPPSPLRPAEGDPAPENAPHTLLLSARTPGSLQRLARAHAERLRQGERDAAQLFHYTRASALRRTHHPLRAGAVAPDAALLAEKLDALAALPAPRAAGQDPRILMVFSGQGARPGMGLELAAAEPLVKRALDAHDRLLREVAGWSLWELLEEKAEIKRVDQIDFAHPAQVAVQLALIDLWRAWGVEPHAAIGHSLGEIPAAVAAGVLDGPSALKLAVARSRLSASPAARGRMAQIYLPVAQVREAIAPHGEKLSVAAVNGPRTTVISGEPEAVEAVVAQLKRAGAHCWRLGIAAAGHSARMGPLGEELARQVAPWLRPQRARCALWSTMTGQRLEGPEMDAAYWARQLRQPVAFAAAFGAALEDGADVALEVSPHAALQEAMHEESEARGKAPAILGTLTESLDEPTTAREAAVAAWARGVKVRWEALFPGRATAEELPTYRWDRQRMWLPPAPRARANASGHPLLGEHVQLADRPDEHVFHGTLSLEDVPMLADHKLQGTVVMPAVAYVEMAVQAAGQVLGGGAVEVADLELRRPLVLEERAPTRLQLTLHVQGEKAEFQVHARTDGPWATVAQGTLRPIAAG